MRAHVQPEQLTRLAMRNRAHQSQGCCVDRERCRTAVLCQSSRTWLLLQWLVGYMCIARFQTSHWFFYRDHQRNIHCYIFLWFQLCQGLFRVNVIWIQTGWNNCSDLLLEKFMNADIFRDFNWNYSCYCKLNLLKKAVSNSVAAL